MLKPKFKLFDVKSWFQNYTFTCFHFSLTTGNMKKNYLPLHIFVSFSLPQDDEQDRNLP